MTIEIIHGTEENDNIVLYADNGSEAYGYAGDDKIISQVGDHYLDGGDGIDTADFGRGISYFDFSLLIALL